MFETLVARDEHRTRERRSSYESWRTHNLYYHQDLEKLYRFFVPRGAAVLETGAGSGHLLNAVAPARGVAIDMSPHVMDSANSDFPQLRFHAVSLEHYRESDCFDYVLLTNALSYVDNVQTAVRNIRRVCRPDSRLIVVFHNSLWQPLLKLASYAGQRMPLTDLNWLSRNDVKNVLDLEAFEITCRGTRLLVPKRLPLVSTLLNRFVAPLPGIRRLCLTEYIIARPRPDVTREPAADKTCSVIIPARNEAGNIEQCITRLPRLGKHTEVIMVEGHSTDQTWEEMVRVQARYGRDLDIKISRQPGSGKGNAVRHGFDQASGDVLVILDADLTVRPEDLVYFFDAVASGRCELANGCRLIYPVPRAAMPSINRMANRLFARLLSYLLSIGIKDSLCGTKAIARENYLKIKANRSYAGDFDPFGDFDLLFGAAKLGLKISDISVRYDPRSYGQSNIHHIRDGLRLLSMCSYAARTMKFV